MGRGEGADPLLAGHRLMEAGLFDLALDSYLRAAAEDGLTPEVLASLGSANLRLGRLGQSEALLRRAVALDPLYVAAWNNLGVLLMERGRPAEASEAFRRAYAADSGATDTIRDNLMRALAQMDTGAGGSLYPEASGPGEARAGGTILSVEPL